MDENVIIPAYEPDERMVELVQSLRELGENVILVDDGSGEKYEALFLECAQAGAVLLRHKANRGKGAALRTAIEYLVKTGDSRGAVTADSDGQHSVADIRRVGQRLEERPNALIIGGRRFTGRVPLRSRLGNTITRWVFRLASGVRIYDTQTGLRGLPNSLFSRLLEVPGDRFEYEMNMLLAIKGWGIEYEEIPIETIYSAERYSSHFHALRDGYRVFSRIIKYVGASLATSAVDYALYMLLGIWLVPTYSYILARVCSSVVNYELNRRLVFNSKGSLKSAVEYFLLALFVMIVGSWSVGGLTSLGMNKLLAKFIVDNILFVMNYIVQKKVIFKKQNKDREPVN